jgi:hypothetical protein
MCWRRHVLQYMSNLWEFYICQLSFMNSCSKRVYDTKAKQLKSSCKGLQGFSLCIWTHLPRMEDSFIGWRSSLSHADLPPFELKRYCSLCWGRPTPMGFPLFSSLCPWANTLLKTPMTLKLREALGSKDSPIPKGP